MLVDQTIACLGMMGIAGGCVSLPASKLCTCSRLLWCMRTVLVVSILTLGLATLWGALVGLEQSLTTGFMSGALVVGAVAVPCPSVVR